MGTKDTLDHPTKGRTLALSPCPSRPVDGVQSFVRPEPRVLDVKCIIDRHHEIIVRNIVPSEELYGALRNYGVLADNMINDVQVGSLLCVCTNYAM